MALYSGGDASEQLPSENIKTRERNPGFDVVLMPGIYDRASQIIKENTAMLDVGVPVLWSLKDES